MQLKFLLILPISVIGLLSCMPDSTPKTLTYAETLSYIEKNYKPLTSTPTGWVEYYTEYKDNPIVQGALTKLGVNPITEAGRNEIDSTKITDEYIPNSSDETVLKDDDALSLMFLSPTNFPIFINNSEYTFSYQLTYVKELVMTSISKDTLITYTRYYNTSLHLTRFEVNSTEENKSYTATQTFIY